MEIDKIESESSISVKVVQQKDDVMICFDDSIAWFSLPPVDAIKFAHSIIEVSEEVLRS